MTDKDFIIENGVLKKYTGNEENVVIPEGVVSISGHALMLGNVKSVTIPNSVASIGNYAVFSAVFSSFKMLW